MRPSPTLLLLIALAAAAADFPPVPPLPAGSWPSAEAAEPFARSLLARVSPETLAQTLAAKPELVPAILRNLGTALLSGDAALRDSLGAYIAATANASPAGDVQRLTIIAVVDPLRYNEDAAFRDRVNALLPRTLAAIPRHTARAVLDELTRSAALDFETAESVSAAARIAPRTSAERRVAFDRDDLHLPDDVSGPIETSIFSLSTSYVTPAEAKRFLDGVHAASPKRRLVILGDAAMRDALAANLRRLHADFVDDHGRSFTPWTRDPFLVARATSGGVVFVNRPNLQPGREEDRNMVRAIAQELPPSTDAEWKGVRWTTAPAPFHNGQILRTPAAVWISIHSVEPRALELLGLDHVPVETFDTRPGVDRYLEAVRRAAAELQDFYRLPVRFVHRLAGDGDLINRLGGGAGFDLDSMVTILPRADGRAAALVGDLTLGAAAARRAPAAEWAAARKAYGFRDRSEGLRTRMVGAQNIALQQFLDDVATELARQGMTVRRLPLLNVPASLLARDDVPGDSAFLMTWNNVVLETRGAVRRAEGFASLLPSIDRGARKAFEASGYKLELYPPLIRSIILGGGYRCASNHVRP